MADARLEIKAGLISFTGEGTEAWLAEQLDKVLTKLSELSELGEDNSETDNGGDKEDKTSSPVKIGSCRISKRKESNVKSVAQISGDSRMASAWRNEPSFDSRGR